MENEKNEQGINISAITFDEYGEMVVLDDELLELVSGGANFNMESCINVVCPQPRVNVSCPQKKAYEEENNVEF